MRKKDRERRKDDDVEERKEEENESYQKMKKRLLRVLRFARARANNVLMIFSMTCVLACVPISSFKKGIRVLLVVLVVLGVQYVLE